MERIKVLLPCNFSPNDQNALAFLSNFVPPDRRAEVVLFHAHTPVPAITSQDGDVMSRLKGNLSYLNQKTAELESELNKVKAKLVERGYDTGKIRTLFAPRKKEIGQEIAELVRREKVDLIILSRKPGKVSRFFTGSVCCKVVAMVKNITVCVTA